MQVEGSPLSFFFKFYYGAITFRFEKKKKINNIDQFKHGHRHLVRGPRFFSLSVFLGPLENFSTPVNLLDLEPPMSVPRPVPGQLKTFYVDLCLSVSV